MFVLLSLKNKYLTCSKSPTIWASSKVENEIQPLKSSIIKSFSLCTTIISWTNPQSIYDESFSSYLFNNKLRNYLSLKFTYDA